MCSRQPQLLFLSAAQLQTMHCDIIRVAAASHGRAEMSAVIRVERGQRQAKWSRGTPAGLRGL